MENENPEAVKYLLHYAQKINFRLRNKEGKTVIEEAAYRPAMLNVFKDIMKKNNEDKS